jgi:hypothetical protein
MHVFGLHNSSVAIVRDYPEPCCRKSESRRHLTYFAVYANFGLAAESRTVERRRSSAHSIITRRHLTHFAVYADFGLAAESRTVEGKVRCLTPGTHRPQMVGRSAATLQLIIIIQRTAER